MRIKVSSGSPHTLDKQIQSLPTMPFTLKFSMDTVYIGKNVWLVDGKREVCLNYEYNPMTGFLKYAAVVHRMSETEGPLSGRGYVDHEMTALRRFEIRPVEIFVDGDLTDEGLMRTIRHLMCHGPGCKGPRVKDSDSDTGSDTDSMLSVDDEEFQASPQTHDLKTVRRLKYFHAGDEPRHIFIAMKGRSSNGDVLYGASIMRTPEDPNYIPTKADNKSHYKTAVSRLKKCPVHMRVSSEFKGQLRKNAKHRVDVTVEIVDEIFKRQCGWLKVRGARV